MSFKPRLVKERPDFEVFNYPLKATPIDMGEIIAQCKPIELHIIPDGTIDDKPILAFVIEAPNGNRLCSMISKKMLQEGLEACPGSLDTLGLYFSSKEEP